VASRDGGQFQSFVVFYHHSTSEIWPYKRDGLSWWGQFKLLAVFYHLIVYEICPYKMGGLWWDWKGDSCIYWFIFY